MSALLDAPATCDAAFRAAIVDLQQHAARHGVDVGPALEGWRQLRRECEHRDFTGYSTGPTLRLVEAWRLRGRQTLARQRWLLEDAQDRGRR